MVLAIQWVDGSPPGIRLLDQTRLPEQEEHIDVTTVDVLI